MSTLPAVQGCSSLSQLHILPALFSAIDSDGLAGEEMFSFSIKAVHAKPQSAPLGDEFTLLLARETLSYYEADLSAFVEGTLPGE